MANPFDTRRGALPDNSKNPFAGAVKETPIIQDSQAAVKAAASPYNRIKMNPFADAVPSVTEEKKPALGMSSKPATPFGNLEPNYGTLQESKRTPTETGKKVNSILKEFISGVGQGVKEIFVETPKNIFNVARAASTLATTPLAFGFSKIDAQGRLNEKEGMAPITFEDIALENWDIAKKIVMREQSPDEGMQKGAEEYLKSKQIGKYGGKKPTVEDYIVLSSLGFANIFGDPLLELGAIKSLGAAGKEIATYKQVGKIEKSLTEVVPGATKDAKLVTRQPFEVALNDNLKIKVDPGKQSVTIRGYVRRGLKPDPNEAANVAEEMGRMLDAPVEAKVVGKDLVIQPTGPVRAIEAPTSAPAGPFKSLEAGVTGKIPTETGLPEAQNESMIVEPSQGQAPVSGPFSSLERVPEKTDILTSNNEISQVRQEQAAADWEDNFAEKYDELSVKESELNKKLKEAGKQDQISIRNDILNVQQEMLKIEDGFMKKWNSNPEENAPMTKTDTAPQTVAKEPEDLASVDGSNRKTSDFIESNRNTSNSKTVEDFIVSDRAKKILDDLGVASAEKYQGPRNLGVYKSIPNKARFRSLYDVITVSHEGAHGIDRQHGIINNVINNEDAIIPSLKKAYMEFYPTANAKKKIETQLREGFAVFVEHYFTNPEEISTKYPDLVDAFINPEGRYYHPKTTQILDSLNSLVDDYQKMTPEQRIGARMRSGDEIVKKDSGFTKSQRFIFETFNYLEPFNRYSKENGIDVRSFANPEVAHYNWLNRSAITNSWIDNPYHANIIIDSRRGGKVIRKNTGTVRDYLDLVKGKEKQFNRYLIARQIVSDNKKLTAVKNKLAVVQNIIDAIGKIKLPKKLTVEEVIKANEKHARKVASLMAYQKQLQEEYDRINSIIEKNDFNIHDATAVVKQFSDEFKEATTIHDNIWKNLLEFSYLNNLLTRDNFVKWTNEKGYASMKRWVNDEFLNQPTGAKPASYTSVSTFKQRGGSQLDVMPPVDSQIRAIGEIISKSLENTVWVKTAELTNMEGNQELARRFERVQVNDPRAATKDPNLIPIKVEGKLQFYKVADEFKEIHQIMSDKEIGLVGKLLLIPTRAFTRATTSANPFFLLSNIAVDQFTRAYSTEYGTSIVDVGKSFAKFVGNTKLFGNPDETIEMYKMLGGYGQTFAGAHDITEMSPNQLTEKIRGEGHTKIEKVINAGEAAVRVIEFPSRLSEMGTREAEFQNALLSGRTETEAMFAAANVSINFAQRGAAFGEMGRMIVKAAPFFNPAIQATYLFGQKVKEHPGRAAFYTAAIAAISLGSTIAVMEMMDDDMKRKLQNISTTELAKYIFVPVPKSIREKMKVDFIKIKIPEMVGSAVGLAQLFVISNYTGNESTFKEYLNVATSWIPNQFNLTEPAKAFLSWLPQGVKPTAMTIGNFRDYPDVMPILSDSLKDKPLDQQYNNNTSAFSKAIGPMIGISPILLDFWIKSQFGAAGKYATQGVGMPSTFFRADKYLTVGRVYQTFFDQKTAANLTRQTVEKNESSSDKEKYEAKRDDLLYKALGDTVSDISDITKDKRELPEKIKGEVNDLLAAVTNEKIDTVAAYERLAKVNRDILDFQIKSDPNMTTFDKLELSKKTASKEVSIMTSSYEDAYREFNPTAKKLSELDASTRELLSGIKTKIIKAGGSDSDIENIIEKVRLENDSNRDYKEKVKKLENIPESVIRDNKEIYQQAKEETKKKK